MKNYKDFRKIFIGDSDIAALIMVGYKKGVGVVPQMLNFGQDDSYYAYIVDENVVEIGSHYSTVAEFSDWLRIYDDDGLVEYLEADKIIVYRAAEMGCVIHLINGNEI